MTLTLTEQQQAVVQHDHGPALVFAVAGAGKTTAMVHRIERLVRDGVFAPAQILATSFGRANVADLRRALKPWSHCAEVDVRTLHSLGYDFVRRIIQRGDLDLNEQVVEADRVLNATLSEARRRAVKFARELDGLDRQDFLDYVGGCKGSLAYADLAHAGLLTAAQSVASQAVAPAGNLDWYLDLYQLFEHVRVQQRWLTFDDMLLTGWSVLVSYPDLLDEVRRQYACVLVDEFQDVNLAQAEILDLIARPQRNYMAIGDDDQTIYEWRNASPEFILNFPQRYGAQTYLISDNFRCPAAPLLLANHVIAHNRQRQPKRLSLTRGFDGETALTFDIDADAMARRIVDRIQQLAQSSVALNDIAVLVRLNAQTPYIEQHLIARAIPYRVSKPFYARAEIITLINYCRLAWIDQQIRLGTPLTADQIKLFHDAWLDVHNRPKRYLTRDLREQLAHAVLNLRRPLSALLQQAALMQERDSLAEALIALAEDLDWLSGRLDQPAYDVLKSLEERLAYQAFLRDNSGFPQTGEGRALSVAAFIDYAHGRGPLLEFLQHIRQLAKQKIGQRADQDAVTLSTIHQAKGLEWPIVFVPNCNQGILPFTSERASNLEEERRLFYVAVTRTKQQLYLHGVNGEPKSQFLAEAKFAATLDAVLEMQQLLVRDPREWQAVDVLAFVRQVAAFGLERYFQQWWPASRERQIALAQAVQRFYAAAQQRGWLARLNLTPAQLTIWQAIAPLPMEDGPLDFPGLERCLPAADSNGVGEPAMIHAGTWLLCDAGWGRIDRIVTQAGEIVSDSVQRTAPVHLRVTLRPQAVAESIEIDLAGQRLVFVEVERVFVCGRCGTFISRDLNLLLNQHNRAVHGGTGASYRQSSQTSWPLTRCVFSAQPPANAFGNALI